MRRKFKHIKTVYQSVPDEYGRIAFWVTMFLGIPAAMMWLASTLQWFWHWFGWLGLGMVGLISATIVMVLLAAYRVIKTPERLYSDTAEIDGLSKLLASPPSRETKEEVRERLARRTALKEARDLIALHVAQQSSGPDFLSALQASYFFYKLRPYLSEDFRGGLRNPLARALDWSDPSMPPFAWRFANEVDRIERKWGLFEGPKVSIPSPLPPPDTGESKRP
jgi:hypothetical protein